MPLWLVKYLIALAFLPGLIVGLAALLLMATYMQVQDEMGEGNGEAEELHA